MFGQLEQVMNAKELKVFLKSVTRLTPGQKEALLAELRVAGQGDEVRALVESRFSEMKACPHCQSTRVVRNGSASGMQRYKCRACAVTFNALSTTPLARQHAAQQARLPSAPGSVASLT